MNIFNQIKFFAFKGLLPSYYWKHFFLVIWIPAVFIFFFIHAVFTKGQDVTLNVLVYFGIFILMAFIYPYARFVYDCVVGFIFGNSIIISNIGAMLLRKTIIAAILYCLSFIIAPIGLIALFFYNKRQYSKEIARSDNTQQQFS